MISILVNTFEVIMGSLLQTCHCDCSFRAGGVICNKSSFQAPWPHAVHKNEKEDLHVHICFTVSVIVCAVILKHDFYTTIWKEIETYMKFV